MSLPLAFKTELESIPSEPKYLYSDASKRQRWEQRLGPKNKPRVGLVWSGSVGHKNDRNRSIALEELLKYLPGHCEYVRLQKEVRPGDQEVLAQSQIKHYEEHLDDFAETAALCELMDVVVSVDTSVAHLAGAMGKRTWVMLPYVPDWRWLLDRQDSPWYGSMRLYRQQELKKWDSVIQHVTSDLKF